MEQRGNFLRVTCGTCLALLITVLVSSSCEITIPATRTPSPIVGSVFAAFYIRDSDQAIDVVFIPDDDYGDLSDVGNRQAFLDDVADVIDEGFWQNNAIVTNLGAYNFWFMTETGNVAPGAGTCPTVTWPDLDDAAFADAIALIHPNVLRDCSFAVGFTAEPFNGGTVVHEHSHDVYNMPDEYCCDGGYWEMPPMLYDTEPDCENDPENAAWRNCQSFLAGGEDWWRSEDDLGDIMEDDGDAVVPEYGRADWVVMEDGLNALGGPAPGTPSIFGPDSWDWP